MAQLKDLLVNGNSRFLSDVILGHDPTSALEAATKQYVDNNGGIFIINNETTTFEQIMTAYSAGKTLEYRAPSTSTDSNRIFQLAYYSLSTMSNIAIGTLRFVCVGSVMVGSPTVATPGYIELTWNGGSLSGALTYSSATRNQVTFADGDGTSY